MKAEILNTGTELLLGHVVNTHLAWLAKELFTLGIRVERQVTVPDGPHIQTALAEALSRADLVLVTGGLGPTSDDVTREAAAALFGLPLDSDPAILRQIEAHFAARGRVPDPIVARQAQVPRGAHVLSNDAGTAPGLVLEREGKIVVLLPGPPRELRPMWKEAFLPWFAARGLQPPLHERSFLILGIGESRVQTQVEAPLRALGDFEIGYCARPGEVDLRLIGGDLPLLERAARLVRETFGAAIATEDGESLEACVLRLARARGLKLATAESCTGGLVAHLLTNVPGSSETFTHGWVTYANEAKAGQLGVPEALLAAHGAVSEPVARAMAEGARRASGADLAVSLTGIAGPGGGTPEKPVGTVSIACAGPRGTEALTHHLPGDRETFKQRAAHAALDLLRRALL
ncbi:MAG: competence/damage-inducible protein A [Verrucomicrobium sp.]|nr:competence/damage-inducible protein A [Verrucomicrobium sp.]